MEQYLSQEVNWKQTSGVIVFLWCCSNGVHGGLSEGCFWVVVSLGLIVQRGLLTCQALYMKVTHWLVNHWHRLFFGRCKRGNKSRCVPLNVIRLARWQLTWLLHEKEYMIRTYQIYTYLYILYLYISIINRYDIYIYNVHLQILPCSCGRRLSPSWTVSSLIQWTIFLRSDLSYIFIWI